MLDKETFQLLKDSFKLAKDNPGSVIISPEIRWRNDSSNKKLYGLSLIVDHSQMKEILHKVFEDI